MPKKFFHINQHIKADTLRVVDEKGGQFGVITKSEALIKAQEMNTDLVLVAPNANPPVAKLIDFSKFKYQEQQKENSSRKKTKNVEIKEIRMTPFIAENDLNLRLKKARQFLEDGNKVKLNVKFVGRQITRKEFGQVLLNKAIEALADLAKVEREPSFQGKMLTTQLQPKK